MSETMLKTKTVIAIVALKNLMLMEHTFRKALRQSNGEDIEMNFVTKNLYG